MICGSFSNVGSLLKNSQLIIFFFFFLVNLKVGTNSLSNSSLMPNASRCRRLCVTSLLLSLQTPGWRVATLPGMWEMLSLFSTTL